jgi:hypothetical protein
VAGVALIDSGYVMILLLLPPSVNSISCKDPGNKEINIDREAVPVHRTIDAEGRLDWIQSRERATSRRISFHRALESRRGRLNFANDKEIHSLIGRMACLSGDTLIFIDTKGCIGSLPFG